MKQFIVETGPYMESPNKTARIMRNVIIALIPIILFTIYKNGVIPYLHQKTSFLGIFYPLLFIIIPTIVTYLTEVLFNILVQKNKEAFKDCLIASYSFFPGLFLGLILPINTSLIIVIVGAIFASIVGKMLFGGFGRNVFNPALMGYLFITATYLLAITSNGGPLNSYEMDTISGATPLSNLASVNGLGTYATNVAPYGSLWNFFIGTIPGAVGETSSLLCLAALIYLTFTRTIKWKIPVVYLTTVFIITYAIGSISHLGIWYPLFQIFSGGLMFGAVFMATDPVTTPTTPIGQIIFGLFLGILTVIIRYLTPFPEGVAISILTMNMFVFIIDRIGSKARFSFTRTIIPFVIAWMIMVGLILLIGINSKNPTENTDTNFKIISRTFNNNTATYVVTQKGYSSTLKAKIVIDNDEVSSYEILEQNDSFYSKTVEANYLDTLIDSQKNLDKVDTVSGATVTSTALKKLLINTLNDYKKGDNTNINDNGESEDTTKKSEFEVLDIVTNTTNTLYKIKQKGYTGDIILNVTFNNDRITKIQVVDYNEHEYVDKIIEAGYPVELISHQDNIADLDTISGATNTSRVFKNAIINTINAYKENQNEKE